jgi:hypothetical protein
VLLLRGRLLDSVDSTVGDNPTAQLVEAAKRATEGSPGRVASASPQQELKCDLPLIHAALIPLQELSMSACQIP